MDFKQIANSILQNVGGRANVLNATHCATRLRFNLKDLSKANEEAIKNIKGVMGVVNKGGQFQVIIGNDVHNVYNELVKGDLETERSKENDHIKGSAVTRVFDTISGIFTPILPAITGAGMLKAILSLLIAFKLMSTDSETYYILNFISDAAFYFLPILLAYTSAVKFNCNPFMAMSLGGVILHPNFSALVSKSEPVKFLMLPVTLSTYSSSVIPIILIVLFMSYVERFAENVSPSPLKFFLKPLITLVVVAPISLIVIGPLGTIIGNYVVAGVMILNGKFGWLVVGIIGALSPLLVMTGMHYCFLPIAMTALTATGFEGMLLPGMLAANIAQGAAALCVALKTKNKDLKQLAISSGFTAVLGITEPAMYGVNLKLKRPFFAVIIGGAAGGLFGGLSGVKSFAFASPGLAALPIFIGPENNIMKSIGTCIIAFVVTFIATLMLGFKDPVEETIEKANTDMEENKDVVMVPRDALLNIINIPSPVTGIVVPLSQVNDEAFSKEIVGKGIAVIPKEGKIISPIDGIIKKMFKTKHGIGLLSEDGVEILIHIGIETVNLEGKYFKAHVKDGDKVKKGDLLVEFDKSAIMSEGYDIVTPIIITNCEKYLDVIPNDKDNVKEGEGLLTLV